MIVVLRVALALLLVVVLGSSTRQNRGSNNYEYDVIVFGATPAGIAACLAAKASGVDSVLLLEPSSHVGGMATSGIGLRDGVSKERDANPSQLKWATLNAHFYGVTQPVWQPDNWVGEQSFLSMLEESGTKVRTNSTFVEGKSGVLLDKEQRKIVALLLESGDTLEAKYFIDASYEGELMMATGEVSYTFGREPKSQYNESFGGISRGSLGQFAFSINPYLDEKSQKLLKWIDDGPDPRSHVGEGDPNVMAYSFRPCLTRHNTSMVPITKPPGYDPQDFELQRRYLQAELKHSKNATLPWQNLGYYNYPANRESKLDACCGYSPVGVDVVGLALGYSSGTRAQRRKIYLDHKYYVQGLMWFWNNDPAVPLEVREWMGSYGLCKDEWADNDHFPPQLYVREAARLVGKRVFTQNDRVSCHSYSIAHPSLPADTVAIGSWGFDIHDMQRVSIKHDTTGEPMVYNEGLTDYNYGGLDPYPIPFYVVLPKREEMQNLAVINCPSVSHVAFSSIRVEPTLWQLGQAAAAAVGVALKLDAANNGSTNSFKALQDVEVEEVRKVLLQQELSVLP